MRAPRPTARRIRLMLLAVVLGTFPLGGFICDDDDGPLQGQTEGTERWIVFLKGAPIDLASFREEAKKGPAERAKAAAAVRAKASKSHEAFAKVLTDAGGTVVEHWWMTHAVTVQIPAGTSEDVAKFEGVLRIAPDSLLQ